MRRLEVRAYLSGDFETWTAFVEVQKVGRETLKGEAQGATWNEAVERALQKVGAFE